MASVADVVRKHRENLKQITMTQQDKQPLTFHKGALSTNRQESTRDRRRRLSRSIETA